MVMVTLYLEDIFSLVLAVEADGAVEDAEDRQWLAATLLGTHVTVEQQLVALQAHPELHPVLVLRPEGERGGGGRGRGRG